MKHISFYVFLAIFLISGIKSTAQSYVFPPEIAPFEWDQSSETGLDYLFLNNLKPVPPSPYLNAALILDSTGHIVFWLPGLGNDFRIHPNGQIAFIDQSDRYLVLDSTFTVIDTPGCKNGFSVDGHEILLLENGHRIMLCNEEQPADLSTFNTNTGAPGNDSAMIQGQVIQEIDEHDSLIWEWKSLDYLNWEDTDSLFFTNPSRLDPFHINSIQFDIDSNFILTLRHTNEVIKVNREDSSVMWRLGGPRSDFTLTNDSGFSGPHDAQILPIEGGLGIFDNALYGTPGNPRMAEFSLDTSSMEATKIWEFSKPGGFSNAMGSIQELANGNRLINWGLSPDLPWLDISLVSPDSTTLLEIDLQNRYHSYRTRSATIPWDLPRPEISCIPGDSSLVLDAGPGYGSYWWSTGDTTQTITVSFPGEYYVFVDQGIGFISSEVYSVTQLDSPCKTVDISNPMQVQYSQAYPNPFTDQLQLTFNSRRTRSITLHDLNGKIICSESGDHSEWILSELNKLNPGIYILNIKDGERTSFQKVIKMNH